MSDLLIGRRAAYTRTESRWNKETEKHEETKREIFKGTIAGLVAAGDSVMIVLLYDDGSVRAHCLDSITVEAKTEAPYR